MDFRLTEEQRMLQMMAREFSEAELAPNASAWDEAGTFPEEAIRKMGPLGLMGIMVPEKLGGAGMGMLSYVLALEEIAAACASTAVTISVHNSLFLGGLLQFGADAQKKKYVPPFAAGKSLGAFALSEPGTGSDAAALKTLACREGSRYLLSGTKNFITNGPHADAMILFAMTDRAKGKRGISAFVVEKTFPGFAVGKIEKKMGLCASSTSEIVLDNCEVPAENLLGKEGEGYGIAMKLLDAGRVGIAAQAVGIARRALETAASYAKTREAFGRPIAEFEGIRWKLADMSVGIAAARLLAWRAAWLRDEGQPFAKEAAQAKLFASEMAVDAAREGVQILGGYGYCRDYLVERLYRDAKATEIYEGTSEIQRLVISKHELQTP